MPTPAQDDETRDAPDTSHVQWSALPDLGDDEEHVGSVPDHEPAPDERQPPPETIWGVF